ncbi:hypothetical protein MRX96_026707 [Rhipicephalus microplus]
MQFPPDGLCTITTFYDLIKDADVTPILTYREDFSYFLETASGHQNTEYGIGIGYSLCKNPTSVRAFVNSRTTKSLLDSLWMYRVYHFGQLHQPIRNQRLRPEVTGTLAKCLQMVSALMNDKKDGMSRPSYTILHFPLLRRRWAGIVARQLRIYPVDIFVAIAHHPEPDYMYADCYMVPPTITSRRLLPHAPANAYPVRLGTPGNYTLGFSCATEEHSPRGQMVNVTEACIDQKYSGNFQYDVAYKSEFTYNKNEKWLFTYDTARALRLKLCETKKNMTQPPLHHTFSPSSTRPPDNETACLKAT